MPCTALSMSQPVGLPTPAYTCLHQPACLPAGHLQNLNPPHLPSPTALASRHHQVLPSCPAMYRPACPCPHLSAYTCLHQPACLHQPGRSRTCHQATNCLHFPFYRAAPWRAQRVYRQHTSNTPPNVKEPCQPVAKPLFMTTNTQREIVHVFFI